MEQLKQVRDRLLEKIYVQEKKDRENKADDNEGIMRNKKKRSRWKKSGKRHSESLFSNEGQAYAGVSELKFLQEACNFSRLLLLICCKQPLMYIFVVPFSAVL